MKHERFQILSLDGGGLKGLFSAAVLASFEDDLNINICDHFDLITGTSTGGIIALALGAGMVPAEIVQFYCKNGLAIFRKDPLSFAKHFFRHKFNADMLEKSLKEQFGDRILRDSTKRLVIPSYNIDADTVYLFKTPHHQRFRRDWKVPMWKVAMATSAAPTYFPAFKGLDLIRLVDGAVWANNPVVVGITEAVGILELPLTSLRVLSLGTTDEVKGRPKWLDRGGRMQWCLQAMEVILRGQSVGANAQAIHLLGKDNFMRVDPPAPAGLYRIDKCDFDDLLSAAAHHSRQYSPRFKDLFCGHRAPEFKATRNEDNA